MSSYVCRHNGFHSKTLILVDDPSEFLAQRYLTKNKGWDWFRGNVALHIFKQQLFYIYYLFCGFLGGKQIVMFPFIYMVVVNMSYGIKFDLTGLFNSQT